MTATAAALNDCDGPVSRRRPLRPPDARRRACLFNGDNVDEDLTSCHHDRRTLRAAGGLIDPHTAVGLAAAAAPPADPAVPLVALATAHPAKFPDAVEAATGVRPPLPPRLADLMSAAERFTVLPNDLGRRPGFIRASVRSRMGA